MEVVPSLHRNYVGLYRSWYRGATFCWTNGSAHHFLFRIRSAPMAQEKVPTPQTQLQAELFLTLSKSKPSVSPTYRPTNPSTSDAPQEPTIALGSVPPTLQAPEPQTPSQLSPSTTAKFALGRMSKVEMAHIIGLSLIALANEINKTNARVSPFIYQHFKVFSSILTYLSSTDSNPTTRATHSSPSSSGGPLPPPDLGS